MKNNFRTLQKNPFTSLPDIKLVPIPDPIQTHEHRMPLRSYLSRPDDPLRSLAEALSGGRRPKTVEVEKRVGPEPTEVPEVAAVPAAGSAPAKWGR